MNLQEIFNKDYTGYTAEDFLSDESFITWAKHKGENSNLDLYWEAIIKQYPELGSELKKADRLVQLLSSQVVIEDKADRSEIWGKIHRRIAWSRPLKILNDGRYYLGRSRNIAAAIVITVLLSGAGFAGYSLRSAASDPDLFTTIYSPAGQRTEITLPDESKVWLNSKTTIRYSSGFDKDNREIFLDGEAFFDVKKGSLPFEVKTTAINVKVLGTAFNIKCYSDDPTVEATLVRGSMKVERIGATNGDSEEILMTPNQKIVFVRETQAKPAETKTDNRDNIQVRSELITASVIKADIIESYNTEKSTGWIDGVLIIEGESLSELSKKIERRYDVKFVFMNEGLKNFKYTGTLREYSLEQVLKALGSTSPISYTVDKQTVYIGENNEEISKYLKLMKK